MSKQKNNFSLRRSSLALAVAGALGLAAEGALAAGTLSYSGTTFNEANGNLGAIASNSYVTISLVGDTFTGANGDDLVSSGKATVSNVPTGLTASIIRNSATTATIVLSGNATSHASANSISNLTVTFADSAFAGSSASSVTGYSKSDLAISFVDSDTTPPVVTGFGSKSAAVTNASVSLTLDEAATGYYVVLPTGAAVPSVVQVMAGQDASGAAASVKGNEAMAANASHAFAISGLSANTSYTFYFAAKDSANNNQTSVTTLSFATVTAGLTYSTSTLNELNGNLGAVSSAVITLAGDTFTGANGDDLVSSGKVTVSNVPAGLTASVTRNSATTATLALSGNATSNASANSIANLTVVFVDSAFAGGSASSLANTSKNNLAINFVDTDTTPPAVYGYGSKSAAATTASVSIALDEAGTGYYVVLPDAAAAPSVAQVMAGQDASGATVGIKGNAAMAAKTYQPFAITGLAPNTAYKVYFAARDNANNSQSSVAVLSIATITAGLTYSATTLNELNGNLGAVSSASITLIGDTFTGANGDDLISSGKVTVSNVPAGLTAHVTRTSATAATLSLSGNATSNTSANSIGNLTVVFADSAFAGGSASSLANSSKSNLAISFVDGDTTPPAIYGYPLTNAAASTASVGIALDEAGTGYYVVLPDAAAAPSVAQVMAGQDGSGATAAIKGSATMTAINQNDFSIGGLSANTAYKFYFVAKDSANNSQTSVTALSFSTIIAGLTYSTSTLSELNGNLGAVGSASITLAGDTFTGVDGDDLASSGKVTVSNVPAGLTAHVTRTSATAATLSLSGNAISNASANSIGNLTVVFANSAFTGGSASSLANSSKSDLAISFVDTDTTPPTTSKGGKAGSLTPSSVSMTSTIDEAGTGYYVVLPASATAPSVSQVMAGEDASGATTGIKGSAAMSASSQHSFAISGLSANTAYKYYFVAKDSSNNSQTATTAVSFTTPAIGLTYAATTLNEAGGNLGAITPISIALVGDTFTGANGDDLVSSGKVTVSNVPAGLTAHVTRISATSVTLALSGNATNHASANSITNLTVVFADSAFTGGNASALANTNTTNLAISFVDTDIIPPVTLASGGSVGNYSASFSFSLDEAGTGYYVVLPAAAAAPTVAQVIAGQDSTGAIAGIKGNAVMDMLTPHVFSITGLTAGTGYKLYFVAKDTSNNTQASSLVEGFTTMTNGLFYSTTTFNEAGGNQGGITKSASITLTGDTFTGVAGENLVSSGKVTVANVPAGLTANVIRSDATTAILSFSGNAIHHANADDVSNLTVVFANSAFTGGNAASLANTNKNNLVIDFVDTDIIPPTSSKSKASSQTSSSASVSTSIDEAGTGYYVVLPHTASAPSAAQVMAGQDASGASATVAGSSAMSANTSHAFSLTGLAASTTYTFYFAAKDTSNNPQTSATTVSFSTLAAPVVVVPVPDPTPSPTVTTPTTTTVTSGGSATIGSSTTPVDAGVGSTLNVTTGSSGATINLPTPPSTGGSTSNAVTVVIGGINLSVKPTESGSVLKTTTVKVNGNDTTVLNVSTGSAQVSASSVNQPLVSLGSGSNAVLVSSGSASATVITSVDKTTGVTSLTLPKPASGNATDASLKLTIGGQDVNVKPQGGGDAVVSLTTVTVNGQSVQVVSVTGGSAVVTASQANQPLLAVGSGSSAIVLTANSVGSEASSKVDSVTGTTTLSITSGSITLPNNAFADGNGFAAIKDGKLYAGEVAVLNSAGKISSVRLGSLSSDTASIGDPLKATAVGYANATVVPNLKGQVARISTTQDFATVLAGGLGAGVVSQGQNANGVLLLTVPGGTANALPLGDIVVDTNRADGATLSGNGKLEVANSGVITTFVPAVADPAQLATQITALDKNGSLSVKADGVIEVTINGVTYALQPGWLVSKANGGQAGITVDADGRLLYQDNAGNQQTLYPVFADLTQLLAVFKAQHVDLVATGNDNGTVTAKFLGTTYTLAPDYALSAVPASHAHDDWWAESGRFYIKSSDGKTAQGFAVK